MKRFYNNTGKKIPAYAVMAISRCDTKRSTVTLKKPSTVFVKTFTRNSGFTLVELLVVITILAILSSLVLFALASVQESAKDMKTRATIAKLNTLVMQKYESYRTRRVPIGVAAGTLPRAAAQYRLDALRELMRMEMPDRYSDITDPPVTRSVGGDSTSPLIKIPSVTNAYNRQIKSTKTSQFENAECLYLLVTRGLGEPDVMEQFAPNEIGDRDEDGMFEFKDGWDRPINFLRWAPGHHSPLQNWNVGSMVPVANRKYPTEHDPFDPLKIYTPSTGDLLFNPALPANAQVHPPLYPLIFCPGPDHKSEIQDGGGSPPHRASQTSPPNNPYAQVGGGLLGEWLDVPEVTPVPQGYVPVDDSVDNVTNHLSE